MSQPQFLNIDCRTEKGVLILNVLQPELWGEELTNAIRDELVQAVDHYGLPRVVLNLEQVQFLTSMGISALLHFRRHVRELGGQIILCNVAPVVADVLITTHLVGGPSASAIIPFSIAADVPSSVDFYVATAPSS